MVVDHLESGWTAQGVSAVRREGPERFPRLGKPWKTGSTNEGLWAGDGILKAAEEKPEKRSWVGLY